MIYADKAQTMPASQAAQSFNATTDVTSSVKKFNSGITGGIGYAQGIGYGQLFLDIRGAYGLTDIQKDPQDGSSHSGYVLIALGYSIGL